MRARTVGVLLIVSVTACSVKVQRPDLPAPRMIDPQLTSNSSMAVAAAPDAVGIRLVGVDAADPIQYRILHRSSEGELSGDPVWSWSTAPASLLETALLQAVATEPAVVLVERYDARGVGVMLLSWHLEEEMGQRRLAGTVQVRVTDEEGVLNVRVLESQAPVAMEMPGDLANVAGGLLDELAGQVVELVKQGR